MTGTTSLKQHRNKEIKTSLKSFALFKQQNENQLCILSTGFFFLIAELVEFFYLNVRENNIKHLRLSKTIFC